MEEIEKKSKDGFFSNYAFSLKQFGEKYKETHHVSVCI